MANTNPPIDLRVAGSTNMQYLATSIVKYFEEGQRVMVSCIGVVPVSVASKAVAIANGKVAPEGLTIHMVPYFFKDEVLNRDSGELEAKTVFKYSLFRYRTADIEGLSR